MAEFTRGHRVPLFIFIITFLFTSFFANAHGFENEKASDMVLAKPALVSIHKKQLEFFEKDAAATITVETLEKPAKNQVKTAADTPTRLSIPKIDLDSKIIALGKDALGNMDVPSGATNNVGWYKYGPVPGEIGTAVLDAHVFAAFKNLDQVHVGDYIYTEMDNGEKLKFKVNKTQVYKLSDLDPETLFASQGIRGLNLITCAGELTSDRSTYTHRLIVFTELVSE